MVSFILFLPKLRIVSIHITPNKIRFIVGINKRIIHQVGLLIIFINIKALYIGTNACHDLKPALSYSFHVPKK